MREDAIKIQHCGIWAKFERDNRPYGYEC